MAPQIFQNLIEIAQIRPLTDSENEQLQKLFLNHPHLKEVWQDELALNALLHRATVASPSDELTESVMAKIHQYNENTLSEESLSSRFSFVNLLFGYFKHPVAISAVCVLALIMTIQSVSQKNSTPIDKEMVRGVAVMPELTESLSADMWTTDTLQDFPAIVYSVEVEKMIDKELLLAMKEIK